MIVEAAKRKLKRVIEDAVNGVVGGPLSGRDFVVNEVEELQEGRIHIRSTLHFYQREEPYCCGEPGCHLGLHILERCTVLVDCVTRELNLTENLQLEFAETEAVYHSGAVFIQR